MNNLPKIRPSINVMAIIAVALLVFTASSLKYRPSQAAVRSAPATVDLRQAGPIWVFLHVPSKWYIPLFSLE